MSLEVVLNPVARWRRRDPGLHERLARVVGSAGRVSMPHGEHALSAWAERVVAEGVRHVAICGGDGTTHRVLTALAAAGADPWPEVMLLHGGTMNTVSRSMGQRGRPEAQLGSWVAELAGGAVLARTRRWPLHVSSPGHPERVGFLFGVGIVARFIEAYEADGEPSPVRAALTLARAVVSAFTGGAFAEAFFRPIPCVVEADGVPWPEDAWMVISAGGAHVLGLDFAAHAPLLQHPGHLHALASASSPVAFARDLVPLRLGRPPRSPRAVEQVCRRLTLSASEPLRFNLDGDLYDVGAALAVSTRAPVCFVLAPGARPPRHVLDDTLSG